MPPEADPSIPTPFVHEGIRVKAEWIDVNRHMNIAYYVLVFDQALDHAFPAMGFELDRLKPINGSAFTPSCMSPTSASCTRAIPSG